jgi:adenylate cyclase
MISEATYAFVRDEITAHSLGMRVLKGREQPIEVYEVLGLRRG